MDNNLRSVKKDFDSLRYRLSHLESSHRMLREAIYDAIGVPPVPQMSKDQRTKIYSIQKDFNEIILNLNKVKRSIPQLEKTLHSLIGSI